MNINIQIEIPDEFLNSITPKAIIARLSENGFERVSEQHNRIGKPEIWKHTKAGSRFMVLTDQAVSDYAQSVYEVCYCIQRIVGISVLSSLQAFGWGKCQTCKKLNEIDESEDGSLQPEFHDFCEKYRIVIDTIDAIDNFGCIHYQFRSAT